MVNKYIFKKENFKLNDIEYINIIFDNNEYIRLNNNELIKHSFVLKDKLIRDFRGIAPVINKGEFIFKIDKFDINTDKSIFVYDEEKYYENRVEYIRNRCINEGGIKALQFFEHSYSHKVLFGNFKAKIVNDNLILYVDDNEESNNENAYIYLQKVNHPFIQSIFLDFENGDSLEINKYEIIETNLVMNNELLSGWSSLEREIIQGYIKIKLSPIHYYRKGILLNVERSDISLDEAIQRITMCYKHDICNLLVVYDYPGYNNYYDFSRC